MEQIWLSRAISKLNQHWIFNFDISRNHKIYHPCIGQNEKNEIKSPSFLAWGRYWFFLPCYMDLQNTRFFQSEDSKCDRIWNPWFFYFFGSDPRASISIKTKIFRNPDFKRIGSKILNWIFPNYDNFSSVRFRSFERHSFE